VRKYHAEPEKGNEELALFATEGFTDDHEGISIYKVDDKTGYILVSDQQANLFHVFPREGSPTNLHDHTLIAKIPVSTTESDGSEVTSIALGPDFPKGLFVAMADDKTFQIYRWEDLAAEILKSKK
jgi:3-phytase